MASKHSGFWIPTQPHHGLRVQGIGCDMAMPGVGTAHGVTECPAWPHRVLRAWGTGCDMTMPRVGTALGEASVLQDSPVPLAPAVSLTKVTATQLPASCPLPQELAYLAGLASHGHARTVTFLGRWALRPNPVPRGGSRRPQPWSVTQGQGPSA